MPRPATECQIILKGRGNDIYVSMLGSLYLSPQRNLTGDIPFRISTALFEIFANGSDITIDNKKAEFIEKSVTIKELISTFKFHRFVATGGGKLTVLAKGKDVFHAELDTHPDQGVVEHTDRYLRFVSAAETVLRKADALGKKVTLSSLAEKEADILFLYQLIENKEPTSLMPLRFNPSKAIPLPPSTDALLIRWLRFDDFAIAYYGVMDVTVTDRRPEVQIDAGPVSLRDITAIKNNDDAFAGYCVEARLTTGIALSLVVQLSQS